MEQQDHETKHVCKVCKQSFLSGRILGGHMRNHLGSKGKVKIETCDMGIEEGYGLRENPKKSWKSSGFNHTDSVTLQDNDVKCSVCGKQFDSPRSLHGHMRHHSVEEERNGVRCKDCGKGFRSLRSLTGHMRLHSGKQRKMMMIPGESTRPNLVSMSLTDSDTTTVSLVRKKKRSNRMRYYKPNSSFSSLNDQSVSDFEIEPEVEEVAMTLMLLSRGLYELGAPNKGIEVSSKHECSDCNEELKVEFQVPIESGLVLLYDAETQKGIDKSESESESEEIQDFTEEVVDDFKKSQEFQCRICNKNFATYQALGGHQTFHRTTKSFLSEKIQPNLPEETDETTISKLEHKKDVAMEEEVSSVKEHKCHICCKKFVSGQALGGHKRAHIAKTKEEQSIIAVKQDIPDMSWWDGGSSISSSYNHESLLVDVMVKAKNAVISF